MGLLAIVITDDSHEAVSDKIIDVMESAKPFFSEHLPNAKIHAAINETATKIMQAIEKKPRAEISLETLKLLKACSDDSRRSLANREREVCRQLMIDLGFDVPEQLDVLIEEMETE